LQKEVFLPENKELSKSEYMKLVKTAMNNGKVRLGMIIQTICATGIRVSELSSITIASEKRCDIGISNIENN
jgi:integrase/recombinase XerD